MTPAGYVTSDLYVAAACLCAGHAVTLVPVSPSKFKFAFDPEAETAASAYFKNTPVPARTYAGCLKDLKVMMYSGREVSA